MDVAAFQDGYLSGPLADEGTEAPVGQISGYIADSLNDVHAVASVVQAKPRLDGNGGVTGTAETNKPCRRCSRNGSMRKRAHEVQIATGLESSPEALRF